MGWRAPTVGLAAVVFALAGCGTGEPADGATGPAAVDAGGEFSGGAVGDATDPIVGPVFPLTLHRTGGIAEYDDVIVLRSNGTVLVNTRTIHGRECQLSGGQRKQLLSLLGTLRLVNRPAPTPGSPEITGASPTGAASDVPDDERNDAIVISVTDEQSRPVDLSDPSLGEVAGLVGALVADVTLSTPATTDCTTPVSPSRPATPATSSPSS